LDSAWGTQASFDTCFDSWRSSRPDGGSISSPPTRPHVLTAAHAYAREKAAAIKLELRSSLATNGVLSDERIDWLIWEA